MDRIPVLDVTPEKIVYEMSESTENTTIDLTQVEDIDALEAGDIYQVPFKKYLEFKDFNRDKYKMCEVCIADQKRRYNGRTPIECTGLKDFDAIMETRYTGEEKEALKEGLEALEVDERAALQGQFSPTDWFKHNTNSPDTYTERWYQTLITSCSAKKRVLRMGRRCGKTYSAAMYVLHKIATSEKKINVLVVAPMQTHLDEIVKTLKDLCDVLSYKLWESKRSTPIVEITFVNGSTVQCVVGANDGTSARGKKADLLWIDETDFVSSKVLEALKAIEMDNPNVETIYTSTPIGEGNLYRFSQSEQVKEFHYPSYVIPHYNEQIHASNKADLGEVAFVQEILALFGVDEHGAFPIRFIDRAETYNIPQVFNEHYVLSNRDKFIVTIGVDWNHDNNGTRILVVAYHKEIERFFVAEKFRISKLNYTQALAVEKVVELNRKYHADHIGCDQGFGAAQIAALRLEGKAQYGKVPHDHPDLKLTKVEAVDFGSSIELRDPITRKILKKKAKQFIVENTLHYLEEARIALDDIEDNELILQLKNYSIVKKTLAGNVYKAKDKKIGDHDLDALMIALYIFEKIYGTMLSAGNLQHTSPAYIGGGDVIDAKSRTAFANQTPSFQTAIPAFNGRKKFKPRKKW